VLLGGIGRLVSLGWRGMIIDLLVDDDESELAR
jgi:hypothetical protein